MSKSMPDVIYAERTMSMGNQVVGKFANESAMKLAPDITCTKYISEAKHKQEIADLEARLVKAVENMYTETINLAYPVNGENQADVVYKDEAIELIHNVIGDKI